MPKKLPFIIGSSVTGVFISVGLIFWLVLSILKSSQPFKMAIAELQASSRVNQHFGLDWKPGWWVTGSISVTGDQGVACLNIPLSGVEKSEGIAYLDAAKRQGEWEINELVVNMTNSASFLPQDTFELVTPTDGRKKVCGASSTAE